MTPNAFLCTCKCARFCAEDSWIPRFPFHEIHPKCVHPVLKNPPIKRWRKNSQSSWPKPGLMGLDATMGYLGTFQRTVTTLSAKPRVQQSSWAGEPGTRFPFARCPIVPTLSLHPMRISHDSLRRRSNVPWTCVTHPRTFTSLAGPVSTTKQFFTTTVKRFSCQRFPMPSVILTGLECHWTDTSWSRSRECTGSTRNVLIPSCSTSTLPAASCLKAVSDPIALAPEHCLFSASEWNLIFPRVCFPC